MTPTLAPTFFTEYGIHTMPQFVTMGRRLQWPATTVSYHPMNGNGYRIVTDFLGTEDRLVVLCQNSRHAPSVCAFRPLPDYAVAVCTGPDVIRSTYRSDEVFRLSSVHVFHIDGSKAAEIRIDDPLFRRRWEEHLAFAALEVA